VSRDGRPLGFFSVTYTTDHHFDDAEQHLLTALAERAAVAISNAELFERAQQAASLEERQRLARELHDSVSQALYGIALGARTARTLLDRDPHAVVEPVDYILSLAEAGLAEMRALIFELRPESLENEGLNAAIRKQVEAVQTRHGIQVDFLPREEPDLPLAVKEAVYRIAQESLTNVVKHSQATQVRVMLASTGAGLELEVADNGMGFDSAGDFPGHLGLRSMTERAEKAGGRLEISSQAGVGTRVIATFAVR
jgi:signal transduction histidine kinase